MGWRKKMGVEQEEINSNPYIQKLQNIQKVKQENKNKAFVPSVPFVVKSQKVKTLQKQIDDVWDQADKLADWIDNPDSDVLWQKRAAKVVPLVGQIKPQNCPACCKRSGKCYGKVYFEGKSGRAEQCRSLQCPWSNQLKQLLNRKEN